MTSFSDKEIIDPALKEIANKMVIAATTAPKAKGKNNLVISLATGHTIKMISDKLKEMGDQLNIPLFNRDAQNILSASILFLIGSKIDSLDLKKCGMCGFINCEEKNKNPDVPCAFNTGDLGIAIGSAASIAMDNRVDNRILYTVGQALLELKFLGDDVKIAYGIPLSASGKNPFFDRNKFIS